MGGDRRTVTVRLRPGVRYAPPVNREVVAADIEYAIERAFFRNVANGYASSWFRALEGARANAPAGRDIPGVQAVDDHTLVLHLTAPAGQLVAAALVMPISVPVPREIAAPLDAKRPSTYERNVAFTGPYTVSSRRPGRDIKLVRNPNWDPATDFRPAYLDAITIDERNADQIVTTHRTLDSGSTGLMCCDFALPDTGALRGRGSQIGRTPGLGTRWISLNSRVKPFDDPDVRRGVVAGMDRVALANSRRSVGGTVAQHFLPPGIPGFEESGGAGGFTDLDFLQSPRGNRALARRYFRRAGLRRTSKPLLMIGYKTDPGRVTARVAARQLRRLGFRIRLKLVASDVSYARWCGVRRLRVALCVNVGWFNDFTDPEGMLRPTFSGGEIPAVGNVNWSQLRVPSIDRAMDAAAPLPPGPERNAAWAAINHDVAAQAPAVPFFWDEALQLASPDVEGVMNPYSTTWDLSFSGLR